MRLELAGGRRLGMIEYGDPSGMPVLFFHGLPGSKRQFLPDPNGARGLGLRIVALDRPGIGESDPQPGRTLLDWPRDVAAAADRLGIGRFAVVGVSGGAPYAAACAAALPKRVMAAALISPLGPADRPALRRPMAPLPRIALALAARRPRVLAALAPVILAAIATPGVTRAVRPWAGFSGVDRRTLASWPELRAMFGCAWSEAFRAGPAGVLEDARVAASPWGFDPSTICAPVQLDGGERDAMTPPAMMRRLAETIPTCRLRLFPDEGHLLFFRRGRPILSDFARLLRAVEA